MTIRTSSIPCFTAAGWLVATEGYAVEVTKAGNTNALNLGTSWSGGAVPRTSNVAAWTSTVAAGMYRMLF